MLTGKLLKDLYQSLMRGGSYAPYKQSSTGLVGLYYAE